MMDFLERLRRAALAFAVVMLCMFLADLAFRVDDLEMQLAYARRPLPRVINPREDDL